MSELFPYLQRNSLGSLTWIGLKMTPDFIRHNTVTLENGHTVTPQIPNFNGKQSAISWAIANELLPRETKDAQIQVIEKRKAA